MIPPPSSGQVGCSPAPSPRSPRTPPAAHCDLLATSVRGKRGRSVRAAYSLSLTFCTNLSRNSSSLPAPQSGIAPVPSSRLIKVPTLWIYDARVEGPLSGDTPRCLPCAAARAGGGRVESPGPVSDWPTLGPAAGSENRSRPHQEVPAPSPHPASPSGAPSLPSPPPAPRANGAAAA